MNKEQEKKRIMSLLNWCKCNRWNNGAGLIIPRGLAERTKKKYNITEEKLSSMCGISENIKCKTT